MREYFEGQVDLILDGGPTAGGAGSTIADCTIWPPRVLRQGPVICEPLPMRVTGVIQAGGKSTRMGGQAKALMELGGRRIIDRVVDVVRAVTDDLLIVTNTPELYATLALPMVPDVFPDHGSLGGIYSGLKAASGEAAFTVACDMPFLMPEVARPRHRPRRRGRRRRCRRSGEQWETLHACYSKTCLGPMESRLRAGRLKIVGFFDEVRVLAIAPSRRGALPRARARLHEREHAGRAPRAREVVAALDAASGPIR